MKGGDEKKVQRAQLQSNLTFCVCERRAVNFLTLEWTYPLARRDTGPRDEKASDEG